MSNEELVLRIQTGEKDLLPVLWEQVERFVYQQAGRRARQLEGFGGVSTDDLCQSGFLAGEECGISISMARQREGLGLRKLRNPKISKELRQFIEERTPYYMSVGVSRFQNSHSSALEEIVMLRERLEGVG